MCTGTSLPLAQWNILSWVILGSKGTFQRAWKCRALRMTRRVASVRDPGARNSGMAPVAGRWKKKTPKLSRRIQKKEVGHLGSCRCEAAGTCSVVRDPRVYDADRLVGLGKVQLVGVRLEGLG